jgi:hypothetical protein
LDFDDLQSAKNFGALAQSCATSYLRVSSPAGCRARASPHIACIPVSSRLVLETKAEGRLRTCSGSPSFLRYRPLAVPKLSSISRPRRTCPRPPGITFTSASRPRRRRRHATTDLLCCLAAQRGIGRLEGKWFAAALTPRTKGDALQLYDLHSTFLSFIAPFILDLQRHLDHPPDCFRPRWLVGLLLSPFVDAGCECWRHT